MRHHQPLLSYGATATFAGTPTFFAPFTNSLVLTTAAGTATPTYSVSGTTSSVADWENNLRRTKANEARFTGARRAENLVVGHSENFTNANWAKSNSGAGSALPVATANYTTDPLGGSTASRLQCTMGTDPVGGISLVQQSLTQAAGSQSYRHSIWLKANSGTPTVVIRLGNGGGATLNAVNVTLSSTWTRYTTNVGSETAAIAVNCAVGTIGTAYGGVGNTATAIDISVWGSMWENVCGQSNQNPSEYVSVGVLSAPFHGANIDGVKYFSTKNGNTVASNVITEATGAAINTANGASSATCDATGPFGLLLEGAQSNTGAFVTETNFNAWAVKTNVTVTNNNAAGPTGETMAAVMTENAASGNHVISVNGSVSSQLNIVQSVFVKAATRSRLQMIFDAGGGNNLWQDYDVNTGTLIGTQGTAGTAVAKGSGIIAYPNGWYRCWQAMTLVSTAAGVSMTIYADNGGGTYSYAGNSSAALYLWGAQLDGGDAFDTCPRSYPANSIAGVAGGRGVDALTYVFASNASATAGTAYAEVKTQWSSSLGTYPVVAFSTSPNFPLYAISGDAATTIRTNDGTTSVQKTGISSMKTAVRKVASSWTGSVLAVTGGGAAAASGTFDGNMGSTAIGIGQPTTYTGVNWSGNIRNLKLYTVAATAAELASLTT